MSVALSILSPGQEPGCHPFLTSAIAPVPYLLVLPLNNSVGLALFPPPPPSSLFLPPSLLSVLC